MRVRSIQAFLLACFSSGSALGANFTLTASTTTARVGTLITLTATNAKGGVTISFTNTSTSPNCVSSPPPRVPAALPGPLPLASQPAASTTTCVIGSASANAAGTASFSTTFNQGNNALTASFTDPQTGQLVTSNTVNVNSTVATSFNNYQAVPNPAVLCQPVVISTQIVPANATGSVSFSDGSTPLGTAQVTGGTASFTVSGFGPGNHQIQFSFNPDPGWEPVTQFLTLQVNGSKINTNLQLSGTPNPSTFGQTVTLTASVTYSSCTGNQAPTGIVSFFADGNPIGQAPLVNGTATTSISSLSANQSHQLSAQYSGDSTFAAATASTTQTVQGSGPVTPTSTTLSVFPTSTTFGQTVTMTASVTPSNAPGAVTFFDGTVNLGSSNLVNGSTSFATSTLAVGSHSLTASYGGNSNFGSSASNPVSVSVGQGTSGQPASVTATGGTPQSATVGTAFQTALQVTVRDANSNPLSGIVVTFIAAPASGPTAILSSSTATTNGVGVASVTATANGIAGSYTVTGSVGTLVAPFSLTNTQGNTPIDIAAGKTATQSSTLAGYATAGASSAVDSNPDGNFNDGSVTATNLDANSWWQVDLGASSPIGNVVIWNRTDCCADRLSDYWVFVSDTPFLPTDTPGTLQFRPGTYFSHQTSAPSPSTTIAANTQGRYVRVQLSFPNYLSLAEVQVFAASAQLTNVAQGKAATQSSTFAGLPAANASSAVDGNTNGNFSNNSVTATNQDMNAWWQVDLGASTTINSITIWNRTDCCASRLSDYWVFVSDTPFLPSDTPGTLQFRAGTFFSHQTSAPNPSTTIPGFGNGRYVRVQLSFTDYLSLAEVQVFSPGGGSTPTNLAQGKAATQSSTLLGYSSAGAGSAVDGTTDGNFNDNSVTATNPDTNAWWQVDLGASANITSVVVWNRTDCCASRLSDYWVFVSNTPFLPTDTPGTLQFRAGTFFSHQTSAPNPSTTIPVGMPGRYVRIQLSFTDYLSLAEVQVFGTGGGPSNSDLAQGKAALQSSTFSGLPATNASAAVDGNPDGNFGDGSVTATNFDNNAWWQVDLGTSVNVGSVVVWNRTDCCASRLNDYWVFVSNSPFLASDTPATLQFRPGTFFSHQTSPPSPSTSISVGAPGRYVRVQLSGQNYLSLAEVQVFGQ